MKDSKKPTFPEGTLELEPITVDAEWDPDGVKFYNFSKEVEKLGISDDNVIGLSVNGKYFLLKRRARDKDENASEVWELHQPQYSEWLRGTTNKWYQLCYLAIVTFREQGAL